MCTQTQTHTHIQTYLYILYLIAQLENLKFFQVKGCLLEFLNWISNIIIHVKLEKKTNK